ncbi:MAG: hypothetical protein Q8R39_04350 [bacterium]|nr:hypothetical protein [bacterium]MDZ4284581.1 hypothetical protein [Patescibacteria group bacterium]
MNEIPHIEHVWSQLCQLSSVDQDTNSVSLFHLIEELAIERAKSAPPPPEGGVVIPVACELVTLWHKRSEGQHVIADVEVALFDPQGARLQSVIYKLDIAPQHSRTRFRLKMNGLKITTAGTYSFAVNIRGPNETQFVEAARVPLGVRIS